MLTLLRRLCLPGSVVLLMLLCLPVGSASALGIDWITVGDPGNACDVQKQGCFGSVANTYQISKTEVTNAQYAAFLNAVAAADPNALYNGNMGSDDGGIVRSGSAGSYSYDVIAGRGSRPVNNVSFYDSLRFANWLQNGRPKGAQGNGTTEDGAYTITLAGMADNSIQRNAGAAFFLPSGDEWYKAAYYDAVSASFLDFPAGSDMPTVCAAPSAAPNTANCDSAAGGLTDVGSYTGSASPSGTFDQGGNVYEWNEALMYVSMRGLRGGSKRSDPSFLAASYRYAAIPEDEYSTVGFRIASIPEPSTSLLLLTGLLGLACQRRRDV